MIVVGGIVAMLTITFMVIGVAFIISPKFFGVDDD